MLVWIVGAREAMEGELARAGHLAEPLAALLPPSLAAQGLEVVLIGPEMKSWELECQHIASTRGVLVRALSGTLHALDDTSLRVGDASVGGHPDVVVLFNSGIGTLLWPLVEGWVPTVALLLSLRDVPLLLTCFNAHEAKGEEAVLGGAFSAHTLVPSRRNPLAHATPLACVACVDADDKAAEVRAHRAATTAEAIAEEEEDRERAAEEAQQHGGEGGTGGKGGEGSKGGEGGKGGQAALQPLALAESSRSNNWIKWVRGSAHNDGSLFGEAQTKAAELVKHCAKMFALRNMDAWLNELDAFANASGDAVETLAANVMLLAEATHETSLALMAHQKGAIERLARVVTGSTVAGSGSTANSVGMLPLKADGAVLNYSGMPAADRVRAGALKALQNIHAGVEAARALESPPIEGETSIAHGESAVYRNAFSGQYINVRREPALNGAVVARLPPGATVRAAARRGAWLRLEANDEHRLPAASWALMRHPMHGVLLEPVDTPA